jgi:hypothetical protein
MIQEKKKIKMKVKNYQIISITMKNKIHKVMKKKRKKNYQEKENLQF